MLTAARRPWAKVFIVLREMASLFGLLTGPNYLSSAKLEKHFLDTLYNKTETEIEKNGRQGLPQPEPEVRAWERGLTGQKIVTSGKAAWQAHTHSSCLVPG